MEDHALWRRSAKRQTKLSGVRAREETEGGVKITSVEILDEEGERALGKPRGTYVTLECMPAHEPAAFAAQSALLSRHIRALLPVGAHVLVAGLGNESITPDALGPKAASMVLATRHIRGEFARSAGLSDLRPTAVLSPGVLGQTGVESSEIIRGLCAMVRPAAVTQPVAVGLHGAGVRHRHRSRFGRGQPSPGAQRRHAGGASDRYWGADRGGCRDHRDGTDRQR